MLVNGQERDAVSLLDRGLHFGDGLFETIAVVGSDMPLWHRHYRRMSEGCSRLSIPVPDEPLLLNEIRQLVDHDERCIIKLIVTRGESGHGYFPGEGENHRILIKKPWPNRSAGESEEGIRAHLCQLRLAGGSPFAGIKHLNRLEQVMAAYEAQLQGCSEGIVCDVDGYLVEGIQSNLFWMENGTLYTPLLDRCGVAGVMRAEVIEQAGRHGHPVREVRASSDALEYAEAIFLTNAIRGIQPINRLGDVVYKTQLIPDALRIAIRNKMKDNVA